MGLAWEGLSSRLRAMAEARGWPALGGPDGDADPAPRLWVDGLQPGGARDSTGSQSAAFMAARCVVRGEGCAGHSWPVAGQK